MKNFVLGIVFGILGFLVFADLFNIYNESVIEKYMPKGWDQKEYNIYKKKHPIQYKIRSFLISPSIGLNDPLTKRCTRDPRKYNGKTYERREYFECNLLQNLLSDLIFGEYVMKKEVK